MNFALFAHSAVFLPLRYLVRCLVHYTAPAPDAATHQAMHTSSALRPVALRPVRINPLNAESGHPMAFRSKPLRVVRVVEAGQTRSAVGRMLISGRMADVCAELDRLAACEAALP